MSNATEEAVPTPTAERVIIGIDPGTNIMGYAIVAVKNKKPSVLAMGVLKLNRFESHYARLGHIHDRVVGLVNQYSPTEMAIEAPFFGKNIQSMLKLGRAQGVAMAAAITRNLNIFEYEPRKIKLSITGNGGASKDQVKAMLLRTLNIDPDTLTPELDATDALAAAMCHFYETGKPIKTTGAKSWKDFIAKNPDRVK